MKRKLIFTVTSDLNTDQRMQRICSALDQSEYDVLLVGRKKTQSSEKLEFSFRTKRLHCFFDRNILFYLEYNLRLFFFLMRQPFDGICSIDLDTMLPGRMASRLKRKRHIYDAHEFFTESPEIDRRPFIKWIWEWIGRITVPYVDAAYTVNQSVATLLEKKYGRKFDVIRNLPVLRAGKNNVESRSILYQGVLNEGRGLEPLILAMKEIKNRQLIIAGDGDVKTRLLSLVEKHQLNEKVQFLGLLNPDELKVQTDNAWIGINILDPNNKNYYYSLANKFFDYMMSGIPSISMQFPEYQRVNERIPIAHLIADIKVETIVAAIEALDEPSYHNKLKSNCESASQLYNWDNEKKILIAFYDRLFRNAS